MSTYYMARPFLGDWETSLSMAHRYACPHGAYVYPSRDWKEVLCMYPSKMVGWKNNSIYANQ